MYYMSIDRDFMHLYGIISNSDVNTCSEFEIVLFKCMKSRSLYMSNDDSSPSQGFLTTLVILPLPFSVPLNYPS